MLPDFGGTVTYEFNNTVNELGDGSETVTALWEQPIAKYNLSFSLFTQQQYEKIKQLFELQQKGDIKYFDFQDPFDCQCTRKPQFTPSPYRCSTRGEFIHENGTNAWQFAKVYRLFDDENRLASKVIRPINRLDYNSVQVATKKSNYPSKSKKPRKINEQGVFTSSSVDYLIHCWSGQFFVPCRFENEVLPTAILAYDPSRNPCHDFKIQYQLYQIPDLRLTEVRLDNLSYIEEPNQTRSIIRNSYYENVKATDLYPLYYPPLCTLTYPLPWEINNRIDHKEKQSTFTSSSGFEVRKPLKGLTEITLSESLLNEQKKDYLITLWRACLGNFGSFRFADKEARINALFRFKDNITFQVLVQVPEHCHFLYKISGMTLIEEVKLTQTTPPIVPDDIKKVTGSGGGSYTQGSSPLDGINPGFVGPLPPDYDPDRPNPNPPIYFFPKNPSRKNTYCQTWYLRLSPKRVDGDLNYAFTNHDQRLWLYDPIGRWADSFKSNLGFISTSTPSTSGLNTDTADFISSVEIFDIANDYIESNQLVDSRVVVSLCDWRREHDRGILRTLFEGYLQEYELDYLNQQEGRFKINAVSILNKLDLSDNIVTSYSCPHDFMSEGRYACNFKEQTSNIQATFTASIELKSSFVTFNIVGRFKNYIATWEKNKNLNENDFADRFIYGQIKALTGRLKGQSFTIANIHHGNNSTRGLHQVNLLTPLPVPLQKGDKVLFIAYCGKSPEYCHNRWDNISNYGGQPLLPGTDNQIASANTNE